MNNRHRRVSKLKEQERQRVLSEQQNLINAFIQAVSQIAEAWTRTVNEISRVLFKEGDNWTK